MASSDVAKGDARHKIRIKLYKNYLPKVKGKYISRTHNQKTLSVEDVCRELKRRTTYEGDFNSTVKAINAYFDEAVYQVCNGHAVKTRYFSIRSNVGGTFDSPRESYDREKNPISYSFRALAELNRNSDATDVEIDGVADTKGFIDEFFDVSIHGVNDAVSSNDQFTLTGDKIKVISDGKTEGCGIFFVDSSDPSIRVPVTKHFAENSATKVIGITPALTASAKYRVEIVTQYTGSANVFLKQPRTLLSDFELTAK